MTSLQKYSYKEEMLMRIAQLKTEEVSADASRKETIRAQVASVKAEMQREYRRMKAEEKAQREELRKKEKAFEKR